MPRCSPFTIPSTDPASGPGPGPQRPRVVVVGATGTFGSRLVAGLVATTTFDIVVAGRDARRLASLVARHATPRVGSVVLDVGTATTAALAALGAFAVVDAAGPFQGGDYRFARAVINARAHYVDLADARDFVAGFAVLDPAATSAGVVALSGASSTPALSNAVLDHLTAGWRGVETVEIAISPGNRAPRGLSVMRAILSYVGRPVRVWIGGRWVTRPGWGMTVRRDLPGVGRRFLSLTETPDLDIIPSRRHVRRAVVFRAGLELGMLHLGLWAMSLLVRGRLVASLGPAAPALRAVAAWFERFGSDRGGMTVDATGIDADGRPVRATWSLVAQAGDGPVIPTLPALAALRALADGRLTRPGATACAGVLSLADITAEFVPYRIDTKIVVSSL